MKNKNIKYCLLILILILGCKEDFLIDPINYSPILVVDGMITNEKGPYKIKLSFSTPINDIDNIPYEDCTILLYENGEISEELVEAEPGLYITSTGGIQGQIGNSYNISITTPKGKVLITEPQVMKSPVGIDTIYAKFDRMEIEGGDFPFGLPGFRFYTSTEQSPTSENYYLWKMVETFQYTADYHLYAIWNGKRNLINGVDTITEYENWYRCWKTKNVNYIFTGKTSNLTVPKINDQPLHFVGTDTRKLQERYSLLVKQYTIDKKAFYFWDKVEEQNSKENLLISKQPYNIVGNVKNSENSNEIIFGYFTVASFSQKRIYINAPRTGFYYDICFVDLDGSTAPPPHYIVMLDNGDGGVVQESCVDCRSRGGEATKPDFWKD